MSEFQEENFNRVNQTWGSANHTAKSASGLFAWRTQAGIPFSRLRAKRWNITQIGVRRLNGICCSKTWLEQKSRAHYSNLEGRRAELTECNCVLMCPGDWESFVIVWGAHKLMSFMGLCHISESRGPLSSTLIFASLCLHGSKYSNTICDPTR